MKSAPRLLALAVVLVLWLAATPALAGGRAGLIIVDGGQAKRICLPLEQPSVSGKALLEATGLDQSWNAGALCRLNGRGSEAGNCFGDYPSFWGYWRSDGAGQWQWSSLGADATAVEGGDVEGWVWGTGMDGATHPKPPAVTFADVCTSGVALPAAPTSVAAPRSASGPGVAGIAGVTALAVALLGVAWWRRRTA